MKGGKEERRKKPQPYGVTGASPTKRFSVQPHFR
jgi:hypothetical protein